MTRKAFSATVVAATIAWSIGLGSLVAPLTAKAAVTSGSLVKASLAAVYYVGADGKRYVFPNEKTYKTWYPDFSGVQIITDAELASLVIGGNVTYRPGVKLVKIQSDPKVYAVDANGTLRWVKSEALAVALYGADWNTADTHDVSDAFFTNYHIGSDINVASDFSPSSATAAASSINVDKGLGAVSGAVTISLSADNPGSGSIISDGTAGVAGSQGQIAALKLDVTAAAGATGTLTGLKLHRLGISSDSDVDNAYLYDGNMLVAEMASLSSGVLTFSGFTWNVTGTKPLWVKFDLNKDATAGKTVGLGLSAASDVTLAGGVTAGGNYPINGNLMTVAAVTDFGRLTLAASTNSSTVDPGTNAFEAQRFTLTSANQDIKVSYLRMKQIGSINSSDLADFKLYDGATQLGSTVASLDADKYVVFDLSASPLLLTNGQTKQLSVKVNVKGGSTRTIQLSFQRNYDLRAWDANYNVGLVPDTGTIGTFSVINSTSTTVNSGSLTVTLSTASPTGNVVLNSTNVQLAKYDLKAVGEGIKVTSIVFQVDSTTGSWTNIRNVRLLYNGAQIGTTQTSVADGSATTVSVNFTVAAGTTGSLEVYGDIASASGAADAMAAADSVQVRLNTGSSNGQRIDSLGTFNVPSANTQANELVVASGALAVALNASLGSVTVVQSQAQARIASWTMTATNEGVELSTIVVDEVDGSDTGATTNALGAAFTNLTLKSGGVQLAPVVVPNTSDADSTDYTFSLSPALTIAAGTSISVDLYADALSNADAQWGGESGGGDGDKVEMVSSTGTGLSTGATISGTANVAGQAITVSTSGQLSLATDSSSPVATQLVMGATDKTLGIFKFSANNVENITVSQIIVTNENSAGSGEFKNLKLYVNGVQVGSTVPAFDGSNQAKFANLAIAVARAGQTLVTVKGDVTPFEDGATSNDFVTISLDLPATITGVTTNTVIARGASGQFATTPAATDADAASQYPFRTTLAASIACSGSCSGRTRASSDIVGKLTLTGGSSSTDAQIRPAMQVNDNNDGGAAGNDWQAPTGTANANAVAADTAISVDGASISWTATTDWEDEDILVYTLPSTADLSAYSRVSFWLWTTSATTSGDDFTFFTNDAANQTGAQETAVTTATAAGTWTYIDVALPTSAATDDFAGLTMEGSELATTDAVKIDEIRFYNDKINLDVSGNLCDTDANCVSEDGGTNNTPVGEAVTLRDNGGTTRGVGYYTGTATTGTVTLFSGADFISGDSTNTSALTASDLTPVAGLLSLGTAAQVFDLVTNTSELVDSDSTATEVLSVSLDLGTSSTAGDFLWWDQGVTATSPINWLNGTSPISVSLGY